MTSLDVFIPALVVFFKKKLPGRKVTPTSNVRSLGGFSDSGWRALVTEINRIPAVETANVSLKPAAIANASNITEIATILVRHVLAAETVRFPRSARIKKSRSPKSSKKAAAKSARKAPSGATGRVKKAAPGRARPSKKALKPAKVLRDRMGGLVTLRRTALPLELEIDVGSPPPLPPPQRRAPPPSSPPPSAAKDAAAPPPQKPGLIFALQGKQARQDEVVWGSSFDLVVRYGTIKAGLLAGVRSGRIEALASASAELEIVVVPKGFTLDDGKLQRSLKFEKGRLAGKEPRFKLTAPRRADLFRLGEGPYGVFVALTVSSALIHSFFLEIHLVGSLRPETRPTKIIDFDLKSVASMKPDERAANIFITNEGDSWKVYWSIGGENSGDATVTSSVTPSKLKAAYDAFIIEDLTRIANSALWRNIGEGLELPKDQMSLESARDAMRATVTAGFKLYNLLSEETVLREALERIEKLPDGTKIAVITNSAVFPWELLYPLQYIDGYPEENYQPEKLWGNRFVIESLLMDPSSEEKFPPNRQQTGKLHISMGINAGIDEEPVWKGRALLPVKFQKDYFDASLSGCGDYAVGYDQVLTAVRKDPPDASLIYFFCHGSADKLEFEKSKSFTPFHVFGPEFRNWPVVFVNACEAGNISPLSFYSFRKEFRKRKSAGLIAPSFPIPTLFAAVFARTFLARYSSGEAVGAILLDLRKKLLQENNPLGLWYSLQCPLDLRAPVP